jgi:hypothetical protein
MLTESFAHFRRCGDNRRECVVYWTGPADRHGVVDQVEHPLHRATRFSYEVDSAWVTTFFLQLRHQKRTARIQLHTHPGLAGHSETDDTYALVPASGFLSLVLPNFAGGTVSLDAAFLVEMTSSGDWAPIPLSSLDAP